MISFGRVGRSGCMVIVSIWLILFQQDSNLECHNKKNCYLYSHKLSLDSFESALPPGFLELDQTYSSATSKQFMSPALGLELSGAE